MWLEVVARYAGEVVYSSGRWTSGEGIEQDMQLRTYEGVAAEYGTEQKFHLLRNNTWLVDTRIPPLGLKQDIETDPVGTRYTPLQDQTWPNYDDVSYIFLTADPVVDVTPGDSEDDVMDLSVRLLYVVNTPEYIEFLADENTINAAGQFAFDAIAQHGSDEPLVLAEWGQSVPLTGLVQPSGSTSGVGESSGSGESGAPTSGGVPTTGAAPTGGGFGESTMFAPMDVDLSYSGCACRSSGSGGVLWVLLLGLGVRRRRR